MLKIYRKTIRIDSSDAHPRLESPPQSKASNLLTIPAMIAGAILGTVVFSAFFALLLIPVAIIGIRGWWLLRKLKNARVDEQSLEAEYTVVSDTSKKSESD
ncbi:MULTISPECIES: hypothetical protein [Methylomonas]|uniref:Uncharacterized protein n=2 Tax=Methylomonas TaxID=416 RepID=A0A126T7L2_9GAMM|nr:MULTISPECIES: hypothetical protein [Methylomonas]AMK78079.1 hypothetical protein JT25_016595 [Methylomonas denitrificans]OAI07624.1 hypothetical protein A1342_10045 [Methylomonas methanica]TCV85615.1 hypothetical protein EDE11_105177 [Methylomonas methanica]